MPIEITTATNEQKAGIRDALKVSHERAGTNNIYVADTALSSPSLSGSNNTANGSNALLSNTTGSGNVGIGPNSLVANQGGSDNIAIGKNALENCNAPDANISVGTRAGKTIVNGGSNIIIGHEADVDESWRQRCIVLGRSAVSPAADGSLAIGGTGGNVMGNLISSTAGSHNNQHLRIYLNGVEYKIALLNP